MNIQTRIHQFLSRRRVNIKELATRFLIDSNINTIRCVYSDADPAYATSEEFTVKKSKGGFLITHEIARWEPFFGTETEVFSPVFTHSTKHVKAIISDVAYDAAEIDLVNQHGKNADMQIVRFADK